MSIHFACLNRDGDGEIIWNNLWSLACGIMVCIRNYILRALGKGSEIASICCVLVEMQKNLFVVWMWIRRVLLRVLGKKEQELHPFRSFEDNEDQKKMLVKKSLI